MKQQPVTNLIRKEGGRKTRGALQNIHFPVGTRKCGPERKCCAEACHKMYSPSLGQNELNHLEIE